MTEQYDVVVVGCGLSGAVVARYFAERGKSVLILERRNHIGGNMYDYVNADGVLVHQYGPHTFHTTKKELYEYMCRFSEWEDYKLTCGAVIDGKYTPTPFNYQTIDDFYSEARAGEIKASIEAAFPNQENATVLELLQHEDDNIREYANFLFEKDYSLYTAKQWGVSPEDIDSSVLKRVPIRFNYRTGYFDDEYQVMPQESYTAFFRNLLRHENITVQLGVTAESRIELREETREIYLDGLLYRGQIVYTGAIDELFGNKYGQLPYRSLRFDWKSENRKSFQEAPVVAYPQAEGFTRITEYTKLPIQDVGERTTYAVEYPLPYRPNVKTEPYYPVLTEESKALYEKYRREAEKYCNLSLCGRLADFQYYNMDQALERALSVAEKMGVGNA